MAPGDRLASERELAASLGVGRITLRAALAQLQAEGYLDVRRGARGGNFVTTLDRPFRRWLNGMRRQPQLLHDLFDLRIAVDRQLIALAARRATAADVQRLERAVADMAAAADRDAHGRAERAFHHALTIAARSDRLVQVSDDVRGELFTSMRRWVDAESRSAAMDNHRAMLRAITRGDAAAAAAAIERELEESRDRLVAMLEPSAHRAGGADSA
jgi:DNA-binding FadR family transcriptional regulator